jgi:hypothetical protein
LKRASLAALVFVLSLAAVLGACADRAAPRFPHLLHLATPSCGKPGEPACLDCNSCHAVTTRGGSHALPGEAACTTCHRGDAHETLAVLKSPPVRPSGPIRFDHATHLAMPELRGQCVPCHAGVVESGKAAMPPMSQCFGCHEHAAEWKAGECAPCHDQRSLARTLPKTFLRHDEAFLRHHGQKARSEEKLCQSCHSESDCNSCHDTSRGLSVEKRRPAHIESRQVHRGDFLTRHAIEASSQSSRCVRCHTPQSCDDCHILSGVSANRVDARNPHPLGWVGGNPGSKSAHGRAARRDIVACASCHEAGAATNCIRCHKVGGFGGNPHPNGWKSGQARDSRMCGYCHE